MINVINYTCLHCFHSFCTLEMSKEIVKCPVCKSINVSNTAYSPMIKWPTYQHQHYVTYRW